MCKRVELAPRLLLNAAALKRAKFLLAGGYAPLVAADVQHPTVATVGSWLEPAVRCGRCPCTPQQCVQTLVAQRPSTASVSPGGVSKG